MFAHTGEFPRFADATPSLVRPRARWVALVVVSTAILGMAIRSRADASTSAAMSVL